MRMTLEQIDARLTAALEAKSIYNAEYGDLKFYFSRLLDEAISAAQRTFLNDEGRRLMDGGDNDSKAWSELYYFHPQINTFAKFGRLLDAVETQLFNPHTVSYYIIIAYFEVYNAFKPLADKFLALKPFIIKGRKPVPANENSRTLVNTGTCPICSKNVKLDGGRLVEHGYQMSGYNHSGWREGRCFGVGYQPIEVSDFGVKCYVGVLNARILTLDIVLSKPAPVTKDELKGYALAKAERSQVAYFIKFYEAKLTGWKPSALPDGNVAHLKGVLA